MKDHRHLSRRGFLKGLGIAAGAAAGTRLVGRELGIEGTARAAGLEQPALLVVFLQGGYNACFCSADSLNGKFGINNDFVTLGNGLAVDKTFGATGAANRLPQFALDHMATIGVRHGISSHGAARTADFTDGVHAYYLKLAQAMGGTASIKAALLGSRTPDGPRPQEGDVSLQTINDMQSTINALGGGTPNAKLPERDVAAAGMVGAQTMSNTRITANPASMESFKEGYQSSIDTLKAPVMPFSFANLATAYKQSATNTAVNSFATQIMAAELMITAGANVTLAIDGGWDTHGDSSGTTVRNQMNTRILPPLNTFMTRMLNDPTRNVVVAIMGDFARSLPGSDHQPNVSYTVMGKYVKQGTTGKTDGNVGLAAGTPSVPGFWAYLSSVLKVGSNPFGANPHALVL